MSAAIHTIQIHSNAGQLADDLALLSRAASASVEVAQRLFELGELTADRLVVDHERPATLPAGAAWIGLQLPQGFRELVAAVRAGEFTNV